jgi:DMSO/TMAO reductase YedYZ molybdopterin-dependent catalytic subunit
MAYSRRAFVRSTLAAAGATALAVPEWVLPAMAAGDTLVPFTDLPDSINLTPTPDRRLFDIRTIDGPFTPAGQFFTTQHYGHPVLDAATHRLTVTGLVDRTLSLSLDDLKRMKQVDVVAGFECSGNSRPLQGLSGNGRWTGVPLREVLQRAGVRPEAHEFVFFGADHGEEEVDFRGRVTKVDQQFGRSLPREKAFSDGPLVAHGLNGEPLTRHQGFPLRLVVPGWYGVANVKWLAQIHVQADPYLGKYQARWYRTLRGETINGEVKWKETAVTHLQLKSFIARVSESAGTHTVLGVVLHDGTPLRSVEVKVDDGPWQPATLDPATARHTYSWKIFRYQWKGATPGEHTIVSRATDVRGLVQPTAEQIASKKTFLEDNSQYPRKVKIG